MPNKSQTFKQAMSAVRGTGARHMRIRIEVGDGKEQGKQRAVDITFDPQNESDHGLVKKLLDAIDSTVESYNRA
jgi:hypothetical protein